MDSTATLQLPKRGRPPKYSPEQRSLAYKQKQIERYSLNKESKCEKTKHQGQLYRTAFKILQDMWKDGIISDPKYTKPVQDLFEHKQIANY